MSPLSTVPPAEHPAAVSAASSIGPERRVSRPSKNRVLPWVASTCTAARPSRKTSSGVRSTFATPRTPSVPNSWPMLTPFAYHNDEHGRRLDGQHRDFRRCLDRERHTAPARGESGPVHAGQKIIGTDLVDNGNRALHLHVDRSRLDPSDQSRRRVLDLDPHTSHRCLRDGRRDLHGHAHPGRTRKFRRATRPPARTTARLAAGVLTGSGPPLPISTRCSR